MEMKCWREMEGDGEFSFLRVRRLRGAICLLLRINGVRCGQKEETTNDVTVSDSPRDRNDPIY